MVRNGWIAYVRRATFHPTRVWIIYPDGTHQQLDGHRIDGLSGDAVPTLTERLSEIETKLGALQSTQEAARKAYAEFLKRASPRAFALSATAKQTLTPTR